MLNLMQNGFYTGRYFIKSYYIQTHVFSKLNVPYFFSLSFRENSKLHIISNKRVEMNLWEVLHEIRKQFLTVLLVITTAKSVLSEDTILRNTSSG